MTGASRASSGGDTAFRRGTAPPATRSRLRAQIRRRAPIAGRTRSTQETDVLDTWFSSGLLPFSVFGWPNITAENRADFDAFYPTSCS